MQSVSLTQLQLLNSHRAAYCYQRRGDEVTRDLVVTYRLQIVFNTLSIYSFCRGDVQDCQHRLRA